MLLRRLLCHVLLVSLVLPAAWASNLDSQQITGKYHTANPERGNSSKVMQLGEYQGKTVMAVAACEQGCPASVYTYLAEESAQLGREVFRDGYGQYLLHYEGATFVNVLPDQILGERAWNAFSFINVYSQSKAIADKASASMNTYQEFALGLSEKIMNQEIGPMDHGDGEYHFAVPRTHAGKKYSSRPITFHEAPDKRIEVAQCPNCGMDVFNYLPDESAILGMPVYRQAGANSRRYLFDLKDGVLLWARYGQGGVLGETLWGESEHYNLFARDKNYIRQFIGDSSKHQAMDDLLAKLSLEAKNVFDERREEAEAQKIANQTLPAAGLQNEKLQSEATRAAERWANVYQWKEAIKYAYFTSNDWTTLRNPLTSIITGRSIRGVVVMERDDGLCSFHRVSFAQDYNGSSYANLTMTGLVPGQIKLKCDRTLF